MSAFRIEARSVATSAVGQFRLPTACSWTCPGASAYPLKADLLVFEIKVGPRPDSASIWRAYYHSSSSLPRIWRMLPHHYLALQFLQELPRFVDLIRSFPNYDVKALIQRFHDTGVRTGK